jgi:hypothetical protein
VHEGDAEVVLQRLDEELHLLAELEVQGAERLVEEQHARTVHERARERDPLLLPAGELSRLALLVAGELDELEDLEHAAAQVAALDAPAAQAEGDVLVDREVREERVALEDRVHVPLVRRQPGHVAVAEVDRSRGRLLEAADHAERGRLPAPRGAEQREEATPRDLERDPVHGHDVVEALRDGREADIGGSGSLGVLPLRLHLVLERAHLTRFSP